MVFFLGLTIPPLLSGKFIQEKTVVGLKNPLTSRGDFLISKDQGIVWRTQKPFLSAFSITPKGIWIIKQSDSTLQREPLHQGQVGGAMELIQKILSGDPRALAKYFTVSEQGDSAVWTLDLKPLDPLLARVMTGIRMQGGSHVDHIEFMEGNGDRTRIEFTDVVDNAGDLKLWQSAAFRD